MNPARKAPGFLVRRGREMEDGMHLYWRVFEELKWMGEYAFFIDPSLRRSFENWLRTHALAIAMTEGYSPEGHAREGCVLH